MSKTRGYVYILTNPSFRDDWVKIWKSSRPVNVRSKELYNTAVPLPFVIYATIQTEKYEDIESNMHDMFWDLAWSRINDKREFFNITPEKAFKFLVKEAKLCDDAEILWPEFYNRTKDGNIPQKPLWPDPKPNNENIIIEKLWNNKVILWKEWKWEVDKNKINNKLFHHKRKEMDWKLICIDWIYILKAWSFVNPDITSNVDAITKMREVSKRYIVNNKTTEDLPFYSASGASQYICWTASNWWEDRIDENGKWLSNYRIN